MGTKQVIVIRRDLKMRRGKEISQGSHASMAFITRRMLDSKNKMNVFHAYLKESEQDWVSNSFRKITCQVDSLEELLELEKRAKEASLEVNVITDSGVTEFNGVPTVTCLAIGPDYDEKIDPVTSNLKLY